MLETLNQLQKICSKIKYQPVKISIYSRTFKKGRKTYQYHYLTIRVNGKERYIQLPAEKIYHYALVLKNIIKAINSMYFMCRSMENIDVPEDFIKTVFKIIEEELNSQQR